MVLQRCVDELGLDGKFLSYVYFFKQMWKWNVDLNDVSDIDANDIDVKCKR